MQSSKTLLLNDGGPCVKIDDEYDFDIPMGSFDERV